MNKEHYEKVLKYSNISERCENDGRPELKKIDLSGDISDLVDLSNVTLFGADLSQSDLRWVNFNNTNLSFTDLSYSILIGSDLSGADLSGANLQGAVLSGVKGLLNPSEWLKNNFQFDEKGLIVYKRIGRTEFDPPIHWDIKSGSFITEVCNPNRTNNCGCGVNFATKEWCLSSYIFSELWKCRINYLDLAGVIVPYNTDGKARCERLELLEIVEKEQHE